VTRARRAGASIARVLLPLATLAGLACTRAPAAEEARRLAPGRYFLVTAGGARAFSEPAAAATSAAGADPNARLGPGFGVSIVEERLQNGRRIGRTSKDRWIAMAELEPARPAALAGAELAPGASLDFAWVVTDGAPVFAGPQPAAARRGTRALWSREPLAEPCPFGAASCRTTRGWMRGEDLRAPALAPRPGDVGATERWLDVDHGTQTLVAYEGDRPVFATLISGGIGRPGSPLATPEGTFRVHTKVLAATMDNLEHTGVVPYSYEDIPLVQYFSPRAALHAALWHRRFGHPASHGCINLAPADAERLFGFTSPRVAPGVAAVSADAIAPGTTIRVRGARRPR
jgi:hypothetical protein